MSCMDVRVGLWGKPSAEKLMLLNYGVGEDSWESLGLQGDPNSLLKKISPGCSLEGLMLKLKLQYFGHLMQRADSSEKTLMLGGIGAGGEGDNRGWDGWMASPTRWTWVWVNSGSWWWTGRPGELRFKGSQRIGHDWVTERTNQLIPIMEYKQKKLTESICCTSEANTIVWINYNSIMLVSCGCCSQVTIKLMT